MPLPASRRLSSICAFVAPARRAGLASLLLLALAGAAAAEEQTAPACEEGVSLTDGLCFAMEGTFDAFQNLSGGIRPGPAAIGQVRVGMMADFERLLGLEGWTGTVSAYGIYGRQPTATRIGSFAPASNIEAVSTVRLYELWLQRSFGEWGSFRFGQLAADGEFATAYGAGNLVNGTFGWPAALAGALPAGGPAYPLATLGARLALGDPDEGTGMRVAVFSGNPGGKYGVDTDPQMHNRYGTTFSASGGMFTIGEVVTGSEGPENADGPRRWIVKLGGWFHNGGFDSVEFDNIGLSLADPSSSGTPLRFNNNYGGYAIGEITLWRGDEGWLALFGRVFTQPADRNAISWQVDGGLAWRGPFGRANDTISAGISWAKIGDASRTYDQSINAFGSPWPVRNAETMIEVNYDFAVIENHLSIRPLMQVYFNPAAGEPNEQRDPGGSLPNAVVIGLRLVATL